MSKNIGPAVRFGMAAATAAYSAASSYRAGGGNSSALGRIQRSSGATDVQGVSLRSGRWRKWRSNKLKKALINSGYNFIVRWQATSATYLGPGKIFLGWAKWDVNNEKHPIHCMSLTHYPYGEADPGEGKENSTGMVEWWYNKANGTYNWQRVPNQLSDGTDNAEGNWVQERIDTNINVLQGGCVYHKYSDVKINLYGTLEVPITYTVMLLQVPHDYDFNTVTRSTPLTTDDDLNNMNRDIARTLLYSTVQNNGYPEWRKYCRIVRQYRCTINPPAKTDAAAYAADTTATSIREVRWFIRHDRYRNYKWNKNSNNNNIEGSKDFNTASWDIYQPFNNENEPAHGSRLYMYITATSPKPAAASDFAAGDAQLKYATNNTMKYNGSYDIAVRNHFVVDN